MSNIHAKRTTVAVAVVTSELYCSFCHAVFSLSQEKGEERLIDQGSTK
jgi:hypothetical protein